MGKTLSPFYVNTTKLSLAAIWRPWDSSEGLRDHLSYIRSGGNNDWFYFVFRSVFIFRVINQNFLSVFFFSQVLLMWLPQLQIDSYKHITQVWSTSGTWHNMWRVSRSSHPTARQPITSLKPSGLIFRHKCPVSCPWGEWPWMQPAPVVFHGCTVLDEKHMDIAIHPHYIEYQPYSQHTALYLYYAEKSVLSRVLKLLQNCRETIISQRTT